MVFNASSKVSPQAAANAASNNTIVGYNAGQNSTGGSLNTIAIGTLTDGDGTNNIYIGKNTGVSNSIGSNNIFIGHDITISNFTNNSNQFLLGPKVQPSGNIGDELGSNYLLGGNFTNNFLGINLSNPEYTLDVNGYARIGTNQIGGLGINTDPLQYTLNVNGNMQVSDGTGTMTFTSDSNSNSVTTITPVLPNKTATLQVNDGFFSVSGTTGSMTVGQSSNIGVLKKGIVIVSAQHITNNFIYASRFDMVCVSNTDYAVFPLITPRQVSVSISNDFSSNINITNNSGSTASYTYSITYFPLP